MVQQNGIRSLVEFGRTPVPRVHPVLYPHLSIHEAAPKCISGRTSYHRTRLAFHSYPQVIRDFFNRHRFGPPPRFTGASTCPWLDRTASGLSHETSALFRLGFPSAPVLSRTLTSLHTITRRLILQKAYRHLPRLAASPAPIACRHTVSGLFHSPPGVLFTFPSRYCSTIGRQQYLALDHGRPCFNRNSTCSGLLGSNRRKCTCFRLRGSHPLWLAFPIQFD